MNYTLHQLRIFTKVCDLSSITKASEALYLTQPAVSIQLKKFQEQFEIPLTEVVGRQLYITDFGKQINEIALGILERVDRIDAAVSQYQGVLTGRISIASASTGKYVIPYFLADFMKKYPQVKISIDVTNKTKVIESIKENRVDFALISTIPYNLSVNSITLLKNELYLVGSDKMKDLPNEMKPEDLKDYTLIFREDGSATRSAMIEFLNRNQIPVENSMQLVSNEAVKQAVRAGIGLSIMPLIGIMSELKLKNLKLVKVSGLPITTEWYLSHNTTKQLSPASLALIDYVEGNKKQIEKEYFPTLKLT